MPDSWLSNAGSAMIALPLAAALGAVLAFRPRRRGTPPHDPAVIQTQVILSLIGALVMIVVGSNMARAFGIVGAAGLVRYRAKISDPKDAGVMLTTLAVGLAAGVQLYGVAIAATLMALGLFWMLESLEPRAYARYELKIKIRSPSTARRKIEHLLARRHVRVQLRGLAEDELDYLVRVPVGVGVATLSDAIVEASAGGVTSVKWDEKKTR